MVVDAFQRREEGKKDKMISDAKVITVPLNYSPERVLLYCIFVPVLGHNTGFTTISKIFLNRTIVILNIEPTLTEGSRPGFAAGFSPSEKSCLA